MRTTLLLLVACEQQLDLPPSPPPAQAENLLLVILDDVGIDQVDAYGLGAHPKPRMPTLDTLASRGVRFTQAWSTPLCSSTRASIVTGRPPYEHRIGAALQTGEDGLDPSEVSLPELLPNHRSAVFGKWHLGSGAWDARDHGYVEHQGTRDGGVVPSYYRWRRYEASTRTTTVIDAASQGSRAAAYVTHHTVRDTANWVAAHADAPWFVTVGFHAGHWAASGQGPVYEAPPYRACGVRRARSGSDAVLYRKSLQCMDAELSRLLRELQQLGELEDTTVIVVGDNGTDDAPDGYYRLSHRKGSVYQGGIHVPLLVADGYRFIHNAPDPDREAYAAAGGLVKDCPVHVMDLFATIAEIGGATALPPRTWARSLRSGLTSSRQDQRHPHPYLYTETFDTVGGHMANCQQAVRHGQSTGAPMYKLVRRWVRGAPEIELFDMMDEAEAADLSGDPRYADVVAELTAQLPHDCDVF
jgi:arylsulfatase A-like enzyme